MSLVVEIRVGALQPKIFHATDLGFLAAMDYWDNLMNSRRDEELELLIHSQDGPVLRPMIRLKVTADGREYFSTAAAGRLRFTHAVGLPRRKHHS